MSRKCSVDGCQRWAFENGLCCLHKKETQAIEEKKEKSVILHKSVMNEKKYPDETLEKKFDERNDQISTSSVLFPMQWLDWFRKWREGNGSNDYSLETLCPVTSDPNSPTAWQVTDIPLVSSSHTWTNASVILEVFGRVNRPSTNTKSPHRQLIIVLAGKFNIYASDSNFKPGTPGTIFLLTDTTGQGHSYETTTETNSWMRILLSSTPVSGSSCSSSFSDSCDSENSDAFSSSSPSSSSFTTSSPTTDPDPTTTSS